MTLHAMTTNDPPWEVDPERFAHGTRARYVVGKCRCAACREANRTYARQRVRAAAAGDVRGLLPTEPVKQHLLRLRAAGVGRRTICARSRLSPLTYVKIMANARPHIRADLARRILAIKPNDLADGARISAATTKHYVNRLVKSYGMTRADIARELGLKTPALQIRTQVTVHTAKRIAALYAHVRTQQRVDLAFCADCGRAHTPENRQRLITRMVRGGCMPEEIRDAWPCFYGVESTNIPSNASRLLMRDIAAVRDRLGIGRSSGSGGGRGVE